MTIMEYWSKPAQYKRGTVTLLCDPDIAPKGRKEYFRGQFSEETSKYMDSVVKELAKGVREDHDFLTSIEEIGN